VAAAAVHTAVWSVTALRRRHPREPPEDASRR
jgi:hypothetical protein